MDSLNWTRPIEPLTKGFRMQKQANTTGSYAKPLQVQLFHQLTVTWTGQRTTTWLPFGRLKTLGTLVL